MLTFKYGSISERREGQGCCIKQMQWLGFKPSDIRSLPIVSQHFLKLRNRDFVKISKIRRRALGLDEFVVAKEKGLFSQDTFESATFETYIFGAVNQSSM
ncbi:hypothetical protein NECAME_03631 [Necator americanus]|uniref:Topoisomerase 6 subunit A/Spo11 TOPRIM domain-containing protein n=1 Tax=Necator americanus TaxID=51031 RepID=W2T1U5_NECAM|nr:hypothetical protein NECAME_03631 [Necator americanus]ETN75858.1 hypothetical protein NECAME_03631 [Necator americanus]